MGQGIYQAIVYGIDSARIVQSLWPEENSPDYGISSLIAPVDECLAATTKKHAVHFCHGNEAIYLGICGAVSDGWLAERWKVAVMGDGGRFATTCRLASELVPLQERVRIPRAWDLFADLVMDKTGIQLPLAHWLLVGDWD